MSERDKFAKTSPVKVLESNAVEGVDPRSGLLNKAQAMSGQTILQEETNGAENIKLSDKAKAAIDVLFAVPKSAVQYVGGKAAEFLVNKTPVGALTRTLRLGLSSGLPSEVKQIAQGEVQSMNFKQIVKNNVNDSTKKVLSGLNHSGR